MATIPVAIARLSAGSACRVSTAPSARAAAAATAPSARAVDTMPGRVPRVGRVGDASGGPREWLEGLPPVTRAWFAASMSATCLCSFGLMNPMRLLWSWPLLSQKFEVWRLVTPYTFFGGFSFAFLINMYLLVQYSKNYEVSPYNTGGGGDTADYVWMLCLGSALMCGLCTLLSIVMPAQGLTFMVLYVWSRRNPATQVSLYGFPVQALYLPWALLAFNMLIGNPLTVPLMGVACGHAFHVDCLRPWLAHCAREKRSLTCPTCRTPVCPTVAADVEAGDVVPVNSGLE